MSSCDHHIGAPEPSQSSSVPVHASAPTIARNRPPGRSHVGIDCEQLALIGERDVDERVQRDDGVERRGREPDFAHVGMEESCFGHERSSPLDLHGREVHAGDRAPVRNQPPRDRDAAPTAQVEHVGARGKVLGELGEPIAVLVVGRVVRLGRSNDTAS